MEINSKYKPAAFFTGRKIERYFLFFILLSYFLLAINKIIPFHSVDEGMLAKWAWELHKDPFPLVQYPPLFLYFNFYLSILYKGFFVLTGLVYSSSEFINSGTGYNFMIEAGRIVTALMGTIMLLMVYRIGKEFYNIKVAFFSVVIIAFNNLFLLHSHIFKSDILLSLLITVFIYYLFRFLSDPGKKWLFFASFFFGLSFAAKYNIFVVPLLLAIAVIFSRKVLNIIHGFLLIAAGALTGFFVGAPNWIVNPAGNLKLLFRTFIEKDSPIFYLKNLGPGQIYSMFIKDLLIQFGPVLGILFLISIIIPFIKKDKKNILLSLYIILYILFFGISGFYGNRFLIPLFPALALLAGQTIFSDVFLFFNIKKKYKTLLLSVIWILIGLFSLNRIGMNIKTFGLLKSGTKSEKAINYRLNHNINNKEFNVASQAFSPLLRGDIRFRKTFIIKGKRRIPGNVIHFSQVNKTHYDNFRDKIIRDGKERVVNIEDLRVFYKIVKPKFQTWDDDFLFLYHLPDSLKDIRKGDKYIKLPRNYYNSGKNSCFPLQGYEKSPGFGRSSRGTFFHRIYSKLKIQKIKFYIFVPGTKVDLNLEVNGIRKFLKRDDFTGYIKKVEISGFEKESFSYDFQYSLKIEPVEGELVKDKFPGFYVVFEPVFSDEGKYGSPAVINSISPERIPELFSKDEYPDWIKSFYKEYGIDLSLYDLINTKFLKEIQGERPKSSISDIYPLRNGRYRINVVAGKIVEGIPDEDGGILVYEIFGNSKIRKDKIKFSLAGNSGYQLEISSDEDIVFVRFFQENIKKNNIYIKKISVKPDIVNYLNELKTR
ncbi:MAG: glycosyltransferase family 39 protein [Acidobacteriota bacterium]